MEALSGVVAVLFMAFVVERVTQYLGDAFGFSGKKVFGIAVSVIVAIVLSTVVAFGADFDFFALFGIAFRWAYIGCALTALLMSGGSNVWHDLISWQETRKAEAKLNLLNATSWTEGQKAANKENATPMPGEDVTGPDPTT